MEVVINDLSDLKKHMKVRKEKEEIYLKFDEVIFNCALPNKCDMYFLDENTKSYTLNLKANKITFNYYAECDNIYASSVISYDTLICKELLNVIGNIEGGYIASDVFIGTNIKANTFVVKKICCSYIESAYLCIDKKDYFYIKASSINNII
jgi:energy-converting hydrogenase Eha subunit B